VRRGSELERGDILFFFRPKVNAQEVRSLDDVQRFYFVLHPEHSTRFRRIIVGSKRLPNTERHERAWAFVAEIAGDPEQLERELRPRSYVTKTRGERLQPEARPVGEGRYAIVNHGGHGHLAYVLERPRQPGEAQRALQIEPQASYIVAVRNPDAPAPPGLEFSADGPALPQRLLGRFRGRRFAPLDTPEWLDYERTELIMIGAARDATRELGIDLDADDERIHNAALFEQLRSRPGQPPTEPLRSGMLR
jgi:hypothetical protein